MADSKKAPIPPVGEGRNDPAPPPTRAEAAAAPTGAGVCHENCRAIPGLKRYRVRATNADPMAAGAGEYVLATDPKHAEGLYLAHRAALFAVEGWDLKARKSADGKTDLALRVDELPD